MKQPDLNALFCPEEIKKLEPGSTLDAMVRVFVFNNKDIEWQPDNNAFHHKATGEPFSFFTTDLYFYLRIKSELCQMGIIVATRTLKAASPEGETVTKIVMHHERFSLPSVLASGSDELLILCRAALLAAHRLKEIENG